MEIQNVAFVLSVCFMKSGLVNRDYKWLVYAFKTARGNASKHRVPGVTIFFIRGYFRLWSNALFV